MRALENAEFGGNITNQLPDSGRFRAILGDFGLFWVVLAVNLGIPGEKKKKKPKISTPKKTYSRKKNFFFWF